MEGLIIKDVNAATSIHEHLSKLITPNLRHHHQSQMTRIINLGRVVFPTPYDRLLRPSQITWNRRFNSIHNPLMKFLVPFAQTSGEYMILPTVQLLWVTLIPRLLLLLITLAGLLIIAALTALRALAVKTTTA